MKYKNWTKEEFIRKYDELKSSNKMAIYFNCSKHTILNYAKKINYDNSKNKVTKLDKYSKEELIEIYENCINNHQNIEEVLNCSKVAIYKKLKNYGYTIKRKTPLSEVTDEEFINSYEQLKSAQKMGEKYNCSGTAILQKAHKINYNPLNNKNYKLTKEEKEDIINNYYNKSSNQLAQEYNVSRGMITKLWYDANLIGKENKSLKTTEKDIQGQQFGYWTVLYKTNKRNNGGIIYWHCKCKCGIEKDVLGSSLRNGYSLSCGAHANISKGNEKIKKILLENKIPFEIEKKFFDCKDKKQLPFDFYVNNSYLIEFDGIQHFQESIFDYEYTHNHDLIKNQWCKENNIPLIRIPYTLLETLELKDLLLETSHYIVK